MPHLINSQTQRNNSHRLLFWLAQKWAAKRVTNKKNSESGLSLLEVLIGILIISVVVVASTPALILGVATRVQARRAEEASNIANQQIEQIQLLLDRGEYNNSDLPPQLASINDTIQQLSNPSTIPNSFCNSCKNFTEVSNANQLFKVQPKKLNSNQFSSDEYYLVQVFRSPGVPSGQDPVNTFNVSVRVYYKSAESQVNNLGIDKAPLTLTTADGQAQTLPLAVLNVQLSRSDRDGSLNDYRNLLTP